MKLKLILTVVLGAAAVLAAGCQTYEFQPVDPLAIAQTTQSAKVVGRNLKPTLMFLIDNSGSMNFPSNASDPACPAQCNNGGPVCPATCPTRISELRTAMNTFISQNGSLAWMGMAIFPTGTAANMSCTPTQAGDVRVQLAPDPADADAAVATASNAVNAEIKKLAPAGGTPTADSLRFMTNYAPLQSDREDFVVLLTDGLPNCNSNNPNTCTNVGACKCTLANCTGTFCVQGCLDKDNSATAITELRKKNVRTIVIGFGADTAAGDGPDSLNAMAQAGGFARTCPNSTDAECGAGNTCNTATKICNKQFYQATSAKELSDALKEIANNIANKTPCLYTLEDTPSDARFLAVIVDGKTVPGNQPDSWVYAKGNCNAAGMCTGSKVTFQGALCNKVTMATQANPVQVEFRIVQGI
jgi:hypothetical protein